MTAGNILTQRASLSDLDIQRLVRSENADDRAVATHKICRAMERGGLSEGDRRAAQEIIRMLAQDAAELVRAKTGRINGSLIALLTVMKGLPLAYSKDMQEDKEQVFDAAENLELAIAAMTGMVSDMTVNVANMKKAAGSGYSTATDLADWLVRAVGLPFREAHHVTGRVVALAESKACDLSDLPLDELQAIHPAITNAVYDVVTVEASVASRKSFGGTAPDEVRKQIAWWRARN